MSFSVLVATPTVAFGDLIQHSLEDLGRFAVKTTRSVAQARAIIDLVSPAAAILDGDLGDSEFRELAEYISLRIPEVKLIVIPPGNDPQDPALNGLKDYALLRKPFYLPDLTDLMERLADKQVAASSHWPKSVDLESLIAGTQAVGAILAAVSGEAVLCGQLSDGAKTQLRELAGQFWGRDETSDLVRFVSLDQGKLDSLVFLSAASEDHDIVLGLVFPAATAFSKVRSQSRPIVAAIRELHPVPLSPPHEIEPAVVSGIPAVKADPNAEPAVEDTQPVRISPTPLPAIEEDAWVEEDETLPDFNLAELLGSIPSPDPGGNVEKRVDLFSASDWLEDLLNGKRAERDAAAAMPDGEADLYADVDAPAHPEEDCLRWEEEAVETALEMPSQRGLDGAEMPVRAELSDSPSSVIGDSDGESEDDPNSGFSSLADLEHLDPVSAVYSLIHYSCVLIPRLPQHILSSELMGSLDPWVRQLCLAFGWRLVSIALDREYLQWTVLVSPSISPGNVVKILRQQTSDLIFGHFETLRQQNPSGDFWANGFLAISGAQPPSAALLRDYIAQIRRGQGVGSNSKLTD